MADNELLITWGEPELHSGTGKWWIEVANLTERTSTLVWSHDVSHLVIEEGREAKIELGRAWVAAYGAWRCWWLLREDVVETTFLVSEMLQDRMNEALDRDNHYGAGFGTSRLDLFH